MTSAADTYADFIDAVIPDVNQEMDRICMGLLELGLTQSKHNATQRAKQEQDRRRREALVREIYEEDVKSFRDHLADISSGGPDDDLNALYPGQHLRYWFEVRVDYWRRAPAPKDVNADVLALRALLSAARRVQDLLEEGPQGTYLGDTSGEGQDQVVALVHAGQRRMVSAVIDLFTPRPWL